MSQLPQDFRSNHKFRPVRLIVEPASRIPEVSSTVILAVVLWSILILSISGIGYLTGTDIIVCQLRRWTGWPCPMCGGTRLVLSVLSGRFDRAFWFNPLLFVTLLLVTGWFGVRVLTGYRLVLQASRTGWYLLLGLLILLLLANWVYLASALKDLQPPPGAEPSPKLGVLNDTK